MKVLVTGGAGFIGSNFIRYWLQSHPNDSIINLDKLTYAGNRSTMEDFMQHPKYHWVQGDIKNPEDVKKAMEGEVNAIVHFAAESHVDRSIYGPLEFVHTNVVGTAVLLEVVRKNPKIRFLLVSTDEVYGSLPLENLEKKFRWGDPYQPRNPYAASKASADHLARAYATTYGLDIMVTNCTNNVGPYQDPEKFVPLAITNLLEGKPVRVYGAGANVRDWLWVGDHVRGIESVLLRGKRGETYLFGGKSEISNLDLAKKILTQMDRPVSEKTITFVADRPGHDLRYAMDYSLTQQKLGWAPTLDVDTILKQTIGWYQKNGWWWKPLKERKAGVVIEHKTFKGGIHG